MQSKEICKKFISKYKTVLIILGIHSVLFLIGMGVLGSYIYYMCYKKEYVDLELITVEQNNTDVLGGTSAYSDVEEFLTYYPHEDSEDEKRTKEILLKSWEGEQDKTLLVSRDKPIQSFYYYNHRDSDTPYFQFDEKKEKKGTVHYYKIPKIKHKLYYSECEWGL